MADRYDVVVIGAGPGGYVAALRAAQLGMKTALIERHSRLGGTCLNVGCIPSKALLDSSERYHHAMHGLDVHGITATGVGFDLAAMMRRKESVVDQLTKGIGTLMKKRSVTVVTGEGRLVAAGRVVVDAPEGKKELEAPSIVLASGSVPVELPFLPFDGETVVSSTEALSFESVPGELLVVGAGAIGLELGSVWARLGSKVAVLELEETILPGWDLQVARSLAKSLREIGIEIHTSTRVTSVDRTKGKVALQATDREGNAVVFSGDRVLVAVGRRAAPGSELEALGVHLDRGRVAVDRRFETSVHGVYAVGDLIAGPMLAHRAEEDGLACIDAIAGLPVHVDYGLVPNVVYTAPEAASVGASEEELKGNGVEYAKGSFPFRANGRALAAADSEGFAKILTDPDGERILGAHILGPQASILISEVVVAMSIGAGAEDVARIVHAHPTLSETVREAALAATGRPLHSL